MAHTPGPWTWEHDGYSSAEMFTALRQEGDEIASIIFPHVCLHPETGALQVRLEVGNSWDDDARLIAAAPDLLAACKRYQQFIGTMEEAVNNGPEAIDAHYATMTAVFNQARAAIAKAEGNTTD